MKKILGKSINSKQELEFIMTCLAIICGSCLLIGFLRNLTLSYQLGKDDTDNFIWQILPENITLTAMTICSVLIFLLLRNVKKGQIFTKWNSDLIMLIGIVTECNGLVQMIMRTFISGGSGNSTYMIYVLLGVFILFIACLFKLGIRMQEEQDLTV